MRKLFLISMLVLIIGWFPMLFLCAWGMHLSVDTRLWIIGVGFFMLMMGSISSIAFFNDGTLWKSKQDSEDLKILFRTRIKEYEEAKNKLIALYIRDAPIEVSSSSLDIKQALRESVNAVYFNDSADYLSYHYAVIRSLTNYAIELDDKAIHKLFTFLNPANDLDNSIR